MAIISQIIWMLFPFCVGFCILSFLVAFIAPKIIKKGRR